MNLQERKRKDGSMRDKYKMLLLKMILMTPWLLVAVVLVLIVLGYL